MHRDLKPENLLYADGVLKIADFGLSKEYLGPKAQNTNYVSTRWYRAPELILRQKKYDGKIDIFALGCIMAELYTGVPLMPGKTESDMIYRMSMLIGNIPESWKAGYEQAYKIGLEQTHGALSNPCKEQVISKLQQVIPSASAQALDLIYQMIFWDPKQRPTSAECLQHKFFAGSKQSQRGYSSSLITRQTVNNSQIEANAPQFEFHTFKESTLRRIGMVQNKMKPSAVEQPEMTNHLRSSYHQSPALGGGGPQPKRVEALIHRRHKKSDMESGSSGHAPSRHHF